MNLLSRLKQKLGIGIEAQRDRVDEVEPIHRPSFSIGDSLGDIKVGVMHLKTQLERIEGSMLSKDYFEQAIDSGDKNDLVIGKLDQALQVLADFQPRQPSTEPSTLPRMPSSTDEEEDRLEEAELSLRLQQVLQTFKTRNRTTSKQLAKLLAIEANTACEHLSKLERLGHVRRVRRGLYEKL